MKLQKRQLSCVTLSYNSDKKIISQRNSVIPKMDISAVDNKGDDVILVNNSMAEGE